ncbi:MAG: sirohydrochlorin chelatase [Sciscionella sp.]|nr:sirohydrochlorin chelatase [Sciscionella sp.]
MTPTMVLVAHGTRDGAGVVVAQRIADAVRRELPGVPVRLAFADVRAPSLASVLGTLGGPVVVVPAFLASGYHVRVDVPHQVARFARTERIRLTPALGPDPMVVDAVLQRLRAAGHRPGDAVVLGAAGSTDPRARADVRRAACLLSTRLGCQVDIGFVTGTPAAHSVVSQRLRAGRRVALGCWLLAPGAFHAKLARCGAHAVAEPIGAQRQLVELIARRYRQALGGPVSG